MVIKYGQHFRPAKEIVEENKDVEVGSPMEATEERLEEGEKEELGSSNVESDANTIASQIDGTDAPSAQSKPMRSRVADAVVTVTGSPPGRCCCMCSPGPWCLMHCSPWGWCVFGGYGGCLRAGSEGCHTEPGPPTHQKVLHSLLKNLEGQEEFLRQEFDPLTRVGIHSQRARSATDVVDKRDQDSNLTPQSRLLQQETSFGCCLSIKQGPRVSLNLLTRSMWSSVSNTVGVLSSYDSSWTVLHLKSFPEVTCAWERGHQSVHSFRPAVELGFTYLVRFWLLLVITLLSLHFQETDSWETRSFPKTLKALKTLKVSIGLAKRSSFAKSPPSDCCVAEFP
ncbi:hypothetical protein B0O80DRAFT_486876 [Mortierella sp. GBAus27b]|nr:hypothetical protein B0O80DRAFT_486876 [Mortierella sp. GBAus27b]